MCDCVKFDLLTYNELKALNIFKHHPCYAYPTNYALLLGAYVSEVSTLNAVSYDHLEYFPTNGVTFKNGVTNYPLPGIYFDKESLNFIKFDEKSPILDLDEQVASGSNCFLDTAVCPRPVVKYSQISQNMKNVRIGDSGILEGDFGEMPTSFVDKDLEKQLEREYQSKQLRITGRKYSYNSRPPVDTSYIADLDENVEYEYNGKYYVRFVSYNSAEYGDDNRVGLYVNPSYYVESEHPYWLEVKPIKWLIDKEADLAVTKYLPFAGIPFYGIDNSKNGERNALDDFLLVNGIEDLKEQIISYFNKMFGFDEEEKEVEESENCYMYSFLNNIFAREIVAPRQIQEYQSDFFTVDQQELFPVFYQDNNKDEFADECIRYLLSVTEKTLELLEQIKNIDCPDTDPKVFAEKINEYRKQVEKENYVYATIKEKDLFDRLLSSIVEDENVYDLNRELTIMNSSNKTALAMQRIISKLQKITEDYILQDIETIVNGKIENLLYDKDSLIQEIENAVATNDEIPEEIKDFFEEWKDYPEEIKGDMVEHLVEDFNNNIKRDLFENAKIGEAMKKAFEDQKRFEFANQVNKDWLEAVIGFMEKYVDGDYSQYYDEFKNLKYNMIFIYPELEERALKDDLKLHSDVLFLNQIIADKYNFDKKLVDDVKNSFGYEIMSICYQQLKDLKHIHSCDNYYGQVLVNHLLIRAALLFTDRDFVSDLEKCCEYNQSSGIVPPKIGSEEGTLSGTGNNIFEDALKRHTSERDDELPKVLSLKSRNI